MSCTSTHYGSRFYRLLASCIVIFYSAFVVLLPGRWWLVPFGARPDGLTSFDYWPLFPWLLIVFLGVELGTWLYPNGKKAKWIRKKKISIKWLEFFGRNALLFYIVHIPVLYIPVFLIKGTI